MLFFALRPSSCGSGGDNWCRFNLRASVNDASSSVSGRSRERGPGRCLTGRDTHDQAGKQIPGLGVKKNELTLASSGDTILNS
jgi:hypothetical protein